MTDTLSDWLGQEIRRGDTIVYGRTFGSGGVELVEARVTRVEPSHGHVYCQPTRRSRSRPYKNQPWRAVKLTNTNTIVRLKP